MTYRGRSSPDACRAQELISGLKNGSKASAEDLEVLFSIKDQTLLDDLFAAAREVKERHFGSAVFCYGFVYFSTYCRNNCSFCFYRSTNHHSVRYRKTLEEIIDLSTALEDSGVHLVDLTMGEDPHMHQGGDCSNLVDLVQRVNDAVEVPLMVSPGVVPQEVFPRLRQAGGDWFACYQETHNRALFSFLRPGQDYDTRLAQKKWAMNSGMLAEEGIMVGVGETAADRARSVQIMGELGVRQVRAMGFVPQSNTPMAERDHALFRDELTAIAIMRLMYPDRLIPASLDVEGIGGLRSRLVAGANVITSIIPPSHGLAGVAQHDLDIEAGGRTVPQVEEILDGLGLRMAMPSAYSSLVENWKAADRGVRT